MGDYFAAEKSSDKKLKETNLKDVKKSLNNYLNQLKFHFNLSDKDILKILELTIKSRKNTTQKKKWWQFLFRNV